MIEDLELAWHDDRVGDLDPNLSPANLAEPPRTWALPLVS
jgi:hypothetical protein